MEEQQIAEIDDDEDTDYSDEEPEERDSSPEDDPLEVTTADCLHAENHETEYSSDDETDEIFMSKDETIVWSSKMPPQKRRQAANVVAVAEGVQGLAKEAETIIECWELFFPPETIQKIVHYTNEKLMIIRVKYKRELDCQVTNECEIRALLGLLYFSGLLNLSHVNIHDLWKSNGLSPDYFRATMRENRFRLLVRALRFDDVKTRIERRERDKLAPIRDLWDEFNKRCLQFYSPGPNVTLDEMMAGFRGHCSFKQFLPSKPDRYGLKIFGMVDSTSFFTSHMEVYVGKQPTEERQVSNKPYDIVRRICSSILDTGRNITMDNWFSSIPVVINLLEKHRTTVVATVKKNKTQIPLKFLETRNRQPCSSLFGFYRKMTLVFYISPTKKKNCTILISSMHQTNAIDPTSKEKTKPEIVTYYNSTKAAVDVMDQMRAKYDVARASRRWPLTLFFVLMNIAVINAVIIYNSNNDSNMKRKDFIESLFLQLTKPLLLTRVENTSISGDLRQLIRKCVVLPQDEPLEDVFRREICSFCPRCKNRKTKSVCILCSRYICGEHTTKICTRCYENEILLKKDFENKEE